MSLINEALKRTRDASANADVLPSVGASYRVQGDIASSGTKNTLLITALIATAILAVTVVLGPRIARHILAAKGGLASEASVPVAVPKPSQPPAQPVPVTEAPAKVEINSRVASVPTADSKINEDQIVTKVMERIKVEQAAGPNPVVTEPPKLVLQGITYAKDGGEALINNQTVREGDDIEGAHVVTIENRRVKLDFNGREISLRLP